MEELENLVTTITGKTVPFKNCKLINGKFYEIGVNHIKNSGDCYIIDGEILLPEQVVFAKISSNKEDYLYFNKEDKKILEGVIDFKKNKIVRGWFKKSINSSSIVIKDGEEIPLIDYTLLLDKNSPFVYNYYQNKFYSILYYNSRESSKVRITNEIKQQFPYSVTHDHLENFSKNYNSIKTTHFRKNTSVKFLDEYFQNTYGFEFETSKGMIPMKFLKEIGLMPLRDGSIDGIEYATIPYTGAKGIYFLNKSCEYLKQFTESDEKCSMHIHIGGLERKIDTILAFLKLIVFSQDEFYRMFPLYKKYHFGYKNKSYSEPYPEFIKFILSQPLDTKEKRLDTFDKIFNYLSQGSSFKNYENDLGLVNYHPADPDGNHKWNIRERYKICNIIPIIFGNKKTVEFRIHTPTFEFEKLFLFLAVADTFVTIANQLTDSILNNNELFSQKNRNVYSTLFKYKRQTILGDGYSPNRYLDSLESDIIQYFKYRSNFIAENHLNNQNFPEEDNLKIPFYKMSGSAYMVQQVVFKSDNDNLNNEEENSDVLSGYDLNSKSFGSYIDNRLAYLKSNYTTKVYNTSSSISTIDSSSYLLKSEFDKNVQFLRQNFKIDKLKSDIIYRNLLYDAYPKMHDELRYIINEEINFNAEKVGGLQPEIEKEFAELYPTESTTTKTMSVEEDPSAQKIKKGVKKGTYPVPAEYKPIKF